MKKIKKILAGLSSACIFAAAMPVSALAVQTDETNVVYGDSNEDGNVNISDAVLIMQSIANPDEFKMTEQGKNNADVYKRGDGVTNNDALTIQYVEIKTLTAEDLPESWLDDEPVSDGTKIHLNGTSIEVEGDYAEVNGTTVTITHSGSFYFDGTLDDGQINVNVADETADPETVKIFLNGVNITGKSAPAILVTNAENTSINLMDGTENFISDGDTAYEGDNLGDAVIEAKDDITIKGGELGTGILNLTANVQDGIVCNNDIKVTGGVVNVTTLNATDETNGINGKKSLTVKGGTLNVDAEGDGIKSSKGNVSITGGNARIKAGNDAVQAETTIDISGGTLIAGGDKGLTGVGGVNITGGYVLATATDNQTDTALLTASQNTIIFNCIDDTTNNDGTWKKDNSVTYNSTTTEFLKKYKYVLISDSSLADGSYTFKNNSTGGNFIHDDSETFDIKSGVNVFDNVNPAGASGGNTTVDPSVTSYTISLSANSIETNAPSDVASVDNNVLTIKKPAVLSVSGENNGGQIVVDVDKTEYPDGVVELDLMNASISNDTVAPIYVASIGDEVQIVAKGDTVNTISDGTSHTDTYTDSDGNTNQIDSAIFSRDDIKIKGSGSLTVNGNTADGIVSKNDVKIYNGNITVNAVDDAVRGKDSVVIGNDTATDYSTLNLVLKSQSGDGIKSTATDTDENKSYGIVTINGGTIDIDSYSDGIQGEQDVVINGGNINIHTYEGSEFTSGSSTGSTGGNPWGGGMGGGMQEGNFNKTDISAKGIKAVGLYDTTGTTWQSGGNITVNGGNITVDSSDDSLHCGGQMNINGGIFKLATADDAMHSDHDLILGKSGGANNDFEVYVSKCYEGVEGGNIYQYSGTVIVKSGDDGYNAAGGADGSGTGNNTGWGQGGFGGGMMGGSSGNILHIEGGIAIVQSASGDHDGFDSNGNVDISGGIVIANGQEPIDCGDGYSENITGGTVVECSSQGAGSISANTQFTIANGSEVVVSFTTMQGMGSPSFVSGSGMTCYTGGTISGGTDLITSDDSITVYSDGTISGGTEISAGTGSAGGGGGNFGGGFGGR